MIHKIASPYSHNRYLGDTSEEITIILAAIRVLNSNLGLDLKPNEFYNRNDLTQKGHDALKAYKKTTNQIHPAITNLENLLKQVYQSHVLDSIIPSL